MFDVAMYFVFATAIAGLVYLAILIIGEYRHNENSSTVAMFSAAGVGAFGYVMGLFLVAAMPAAQVLPVMTF